MNNLLPFKALLLTLLTTTLSAQDASVSQTPYHEAYASSCAPTIINQIQHLESRKDAKCYATANRVEYYMFGTPLSDDARIAKVAFQKSIILPIWKEASIASSSQNKTIITTAVIQPLLEKALSYQIDEKEFINVSLRDGPVQLRPTDLRHYSSIAYSLRALLSVQQDDLLGARELLAADDDSLSAMRTFLDVYTLTALFLADEQSRERDHKEVSKQDMATAWNRISSQ